MRLGRVLVVLLLTCAPADRATGAQPRGPLLGRLLHLEATDERRVETIVDRFEPIGPELDPETRSVAADTDIWFLAKAFDDEGVDGAAFTTDVERFANPNGRLRRFRALALGGGLTKDGPFISIGFAMESESDAVDQAQRLGRLLQSGRSRAAQRAWHDLLRVQKLEVRGPIVVAVLPTTLPTLWLAVERQPDSLVWWFR